VTKVTAFIGLGANLDDPCGQVSRAFGELARVPNTRLTARSALYRSAPLGYADQPEFVNAVVRLETSLCAEQLLRELLAIEAAHARRRSFPNAPRTLDLDLLLYSDEIRTTPQLTLPHPRMHERAFVLKPLLEIAPHIILPGHGAAAACLARLETQFAERMY